MTDRAKSNLVGAFVVLCIVLGGSAQGFWSNLALQIASIGLLAFAALAGGAASLRGM